MIFVKDHKYLILLLYLVISTLAFPLGLTDPLILWLNHTMLIIILLGITYILHKRSLTFIIPLGIGVISAGLGIGAIDSLDNHIVLARYTLMLIFYLVMVTILIKDITQKNMISKDLLLGSLCVYIFIALIFGSIYFHIEYYFPHSFDLNKANPANEAELIVNLVYFSFTALTTVGFGDIVATSILAKCFVIIEEITGIFYLAVLVSRLVFSTDKS